MSIARGGTSERMAQRRLLFFGAVVMVVLGSATAAEGRKKVGLDAQLAWEDRYPMSQSLNRKALDIDALGLTTQEQTLFNDMVKNRRKEKRRIAGGLPATIIGCFMPLAGVFLFNSGFYGAGIPVTTLGFASLAGGLGALIHSSTFETRAVQSRIQLSQLLKKRLQAETKEENAIEKKEPQESLPNALDESSRSPSPAHVPQQVRSPSSDESHSPEMAGSSPTATDGNIHLPTREGI